MVVVVIAVIVLVGGGVLVKMKGKDSYSVVYLTTGEVYVGKLRTFPNLILTDAYILTITKDPTDTNKNNFQLNPISEALWAPKSINLVKENIVFYGPLLKNSKIAETLATQKK